MKFTYDPDADAAYVYLADEIPPGGVSKTYGCDPSEVGGMINLDFDADGRLVGVEFLDASAVLPAELLQAPTKGEEASDG